MLATPAQGWGALFREAGRSCCWFFDVGGSEIERALGAKGPPSKQMAGVVEERGDWHPNAPTGQVPSASGVFSFARRFQDTLVAASRRRTAGAGLQPRAPPRAA